MYRIFQGKSEITFPYFVDAWLHIYLESKCFGVIYGPDGVWTVNPPFAN